MWKLIFKGVTTLFGSWIDMKTAKHKSDAARAMKLAETEATYDLEAQRNMKGSLKDEFIMLVWYSPLVVAWFFPEEATAWIAFVSDLPAWWAFGAFGIMAATFGLRWYFRDQGHKLDGGKNV